MRSVLLPTSSPLFLMGCSSPPTQATAEQGESFICGECNEHKQPSIAALFWHCFDRLVSTLNQKQSDGVMSVLLYFRIELVSWFRFNLWEVLSTFRPLFKRELLLAVLSKPDVTSQVRTFPRFCVSNLQSRLRLVYSDWCYQSAGMRHLVFTDYSFSKWWRPVKRKY